MEEKSDILAGEAHGQSMEVVDSVGPGSAGARARLLATFVRKVIKL